jgi:hypothetical protein
LENENQEQSYEFNSWNTYQSFENIFGVSIYDAFTKEEIDAIVLNPILNHSQAKRLSRYVYNKSGIISNAVDYMVSLPCLDRVLTSKGKSKSKVATNKELMLSALDTIQDKQIMRDALFRDMVDGICFYYFETTKNSKSNIRFMSDHDVENIMELNDLGMNASVISLPYDYTKIVGRKNNRPVIAFNLQYFNDFTGEELSKKLRKYPKEIQDGYDKNNKNRTSQNWLVLDNTKTIVHKIKCDRSEPWGRPLTISALSDILYQEYFIDTKRNILNEVNNKIIYQTFPEGEKKGVSSLTKQQQENQHNTVKSAVMTKNNRGGTSFFSIAAGTKLDTLDVSTTIFDEKNESNLNDQIALDVGIAASLLNGSSKGNYSSQQNNLELIFSQIYSWIQEIQYELNVVINENIIRDKKNKVEVYYLPTSLTNRKQTFEFMKTLYTECSGSLQAVIAASGFNVDAYLSLMDDEIEREFDKTYKPHQTSYTLSKNNTGAPEKDSNNESTLKSKATDSNNQPKPSTK